MSAIRSLPPLWRRLPPVFGLLLLAPFVAEFLLGNVSIVQWPALFAMAPMYGGGALLIRELARRTGRGWPTMLVLGLAYGVLEPGVFDLSLFNSDYEGLDLQATTAIPALGIGGFEAVTFVLGHAVFSVCVPIAMVETIAVRQRTTPWLGRVGLPVIGAVYLGGGLIVLNWSLGSQDFTPSAGQTAGALAVAALFVAVAFALRPSGVRGQRRAPWPWLVGLLSLAVTYVYHVELPMSWTSVAVSLALAAVMAVLVGVWSRRRDFDQRHRFMLAAGAVVTYARGGFALTEYLGRTESVHYLGNTVFAAVAAVLLLVAGIAAWRVPSAEPARPEAADLDYAKA